MTGRISSSTADTRTYVGTDRVAGSTNAGGSDQGVVISRDFVQTNQANQPSEANTIQSTFGLRHGHAVDPHVQELIEFTLYQKMKHGLSALQAGHYYVVLREWSKANKSYGEALHAFSGIQPISRRQRQVLDDYIRGTNECVNQLPPGVRT